MKRKPRLAMAWHWKPPTNGAKECARRKRQEFKRFENHIAKYGMAGVGAFRLTGW